MIVKTVLAFQLILYTDAISIPAYHTSLIINRMTNQFSNQQIREIQQAFKLFDKDNDGHLTRQEVGALIREMACVSSEEEISKLISEIDADGNGTVEESQFIALMAKMMLTITSEKDMLQSFKIFDCRHEKGITVEGLKEVLERMGEKMTIEDIKNLIKEADEDGDDKVSFEEFKKLMQR